MRILTTIFAYAVCSASLQGVSSITSPSGRIHGFVYTHSGTPAPNMSVLIQGVYAPATLNTKVLTDANGYYQADGLSLGQYALFAYGDYPGYLIRHDTFLTANVDRAALSKEAPDVTRDLVLPLEAAVINVHLVSKTGVVVHGSKVVVCHADDPTRSGTAVLDAQNSFKYVVPSEERLAILVITSSGQKVQETGFSFKPGENKSIILQIDATSKVNGTLCVPFQGG